MPMTQVPDLPDLCFMTSKWVLSSALRHLGSRAICKEQIAVAASQGIKAAATLLAQASWLWN